VDDDPDGVQIIITSGGNSNPMPPIPTSAPDDNDDDDEDPEPTSTGGGGPYPTHPPDPDPYCFRDHNANGRYQPFTFDEVSELVDTICYQPTADELAPDNEHGFVWGDPRSLQLSVRWAEDQSGCQPITAQPMGDYCWQTFRDFLLACDGSHDQDAWYGGGFVDNYDYGCVQWVVGHDDQQ
jgi:hypothetical protein